jgi:hypothetical protein
MKRIISPNDAYRNFKGEVEIIIKDRKGNVVKSYREHNLIKVFAKEMLAHALPYSKVWDPDATAGTGTGVWVDRTEDLYAQFAPKYILLGASYDANGEPLGKADTRYYTFDVTTGTYSALKPNVGADNDGDLINPIPISEPTRPLKRIESVTFDSSYQPADSPLLDDSVRAMNNVVMFESTLLTDEYNGFGGSGSQLFTITEVALAGGKELDGSIGACECTPRILFLDGINDTNDESIAAIAGGGSTITIDPTAVGTDEYNTIVEGDQIMIVARAGSAEEYDVMGQVNPFYLVIDKPVGGINLTLDRTPTFIDGAGTEQTLTGDIGVYRDTLRLFSQRILTEPFTKNDVFEITIRWNIFFN